MEILKRYAVAFAVALIVALVLRRYLPAGSGGFTLYGSQTTRFISTKTLVFWSPLAIPVIALVFELLLRFIKSKVH